MHHVDFLRRRKVRDCRDKGLAHGGHQQGRGHLGASVLAEEVGHPASGLQAGPIGIEIEAIDAFDVQRYVLRQQFTNGLSHHYGWHRLTRD